MYSPDGTPSNWYATELPSASTSTWAQRLVGGRIDQEDVLHAGLGSPLTAATSMSTLTRSVPPLSDVNSTKPE